MLRINAPIAPKIEIQIAIFHFISLFFIFTIVATIDVGIKNIKLLAWATFWSIPVKHTSIVISIAPPPIPIPLTIPEIMPIKPSNISKNLLYY